MTGVYTASSKCKDTVSPSPEAYMREIRGYLETLYPNGVSYWVLPEVQERITKANNCAVLLESQLIAYETASREFQEYYPEEPQPPVLGRGAVLKAVVKAKPRKSYGSGSQPQVIERFK